MVDDRPGDQVGEERNEKAVTEKVEFFALPLYASTRKAICVKVKNEMPSGKTIFRVSNAWPVERRDCSGRSWHT